MSFSDHESLFSAHKHLFGSQMLLSWFRFLRLQASVLIRSKAEKQSDKQVKGDTTYSVEQVYVKAIIALHDTYSAVRSG